VVTVENRLIKKMEKSNIILEDKKEQKEEKEQKKEKGIEEIVPKKPIEKLADAYVKLNWMNGNSKLVYEQFKDKTFNEISEPLYELVNKMIQYNKHGKAKKFKIKSRIRAGIKRGLKKNKLLVFLKEQNKYTSAKLVNVVSGTYMVNGILRKFSEEDIYWFEKKYPCVFHNDHDLEPEPHHGENERLPNKMGMADACKYIYAAVKTSDVMAKKPLNMQLIIFGFFGVLILIYVLSGGIT